MRRERVVDFCNTRMTHDMSALRSSSASIDADCYSYECDRVQANSLSLFNEFTIRVKVQDVAAYDKYHCSKENNLGRKKCFKIIFKFVPSAWINFPRSLLCEKGRLIIESALSTLQLSSSYIAWLR